jgi:enoyl-CoA hydratase
MYKNIKIDNHDGICMITINRPSNLNALNRETVQEIGEVVRESEMDNTVSGLIITGEGNKAFAAGADIREFKGLSPEEGQNMAVAGQAVFSGIEECNKPVIAAVNGYALGGGCELAMACHIRIASETAQFGQPEVNLGLIPGYGGTQRLVRYIGRGRALELLMSGGNINAQQALAMGLVNYVVPQQELLQRCREILNDIKTKSPLAIAGIIKAVNGGFETELLEFGKCFSTADTKEGIEAFLEKRKPHFTGS